MFRYFPAKHLVGFEPGTFQLRMQRLNPLGIKAFLHWAIPEKKSKQGVEDMEFPGVLKKLQLEFPEVIKKVEFPGVLV